MGGDLAPLRAPRSRPLCEESPGSRTPSRPGVGCRLRWRAVSARIGAAAAAHRRTGFLHRRRLRWHGAPGVPAACAALPKPLSVPAPSLRSQCSMCWSISTIPPLTWMPPANCFTPRAVWWSRCRTHRVGSSCCSAKRGTVWTFRAISSISARKISKCSWTLADSKSSGVSTFHCATIQPALPRASRPASIRCPAACAGCPESPRLKLAKDLAYFTLVLLALPFALLEAACRAGAT